MNQCNSSVINIKENDSSYLICTDFSLKLHVIKH